MKSWPQLREGSFKVTQECFSFKLWSDQTQMTALVHSISHCSSPVYAPRRTLLDTVNELLSGYWIGPCVLSADSKFTVKKRPFTLLLLGWNSRYLCVMKILQFLIITSHSLYTFISTVNGVWHEKKKWLKRKIEAFVPLLLSILYCTFKQEVRLSSSWMYHDLISI